MELQEERARANFGGFSENRKGGRGLVNTEKGGGCCSLKARVDMRYGILSK